MRTGRTRATVLEKNHAVRLNDQVCLATVPIPMAGSPATETYNAAGNNDYSRKMVELASVRHLEYDAGETARHGGESEADDELAALTEPLRHEVMLSVASPSARDWKDTSGMSETGVDPDGSIRTRLDQLPRQAQLADSGLTATGGTPAIRNTGQLDPAYSRWLQGLPSVFCDCAVTGIRLLRPSRRSSSKRTKKPLTIAAGR